MEDQTEQTLSQLPKLLQLDNESLFQECTAAQLKVCKDCLWTLLHKVQEIL